MEKKKIADFLLMRPMFTVRNVTSIGLVAVFFCVYIMAGGKITTIPNIERDQNFGGVRRSGIVQQEAAPIVKQQATPQQNSVAREMPAHRRDLDFGTPSKPDEASRARANDAATTDKTSTGGGSFDDLQQRLNRLPTKAR